MAMSKRTARVVAEAREVVSELCGWAGANDIAAGAQAPLPVRSGYPRGVVTVVRGVTSPPDGVELLYDGHVLTGSARDDPVVLEKLAYQLVRDPGQEGVRKALRVSSGEVRRETAEVERQTAWRAEHADTLRKFRDHLLERGGHPGEVGEDPMFAGLPAPEWRETPGGEPFSKVYRMSAPCGDSISGEILAVIHSGTYRERLDLACSGNMPEAVRLALKDDPSVEVRRWAARLARSDATRLAFTPDIEPVVRAAAYGGMESRVVLTTALRSERAPLVRRVIEQRLSMIRDRRNEGLGR